MNYSYVTVLSNWILGYDKYTKKYSKKLLKLSTYPNEFYLLKDNELKTGIEKASKLLSKVNIAGNYIIRIETTPLSYDKEVYKNERNGLGSFIKSDYIKVHKVFILEGKNWSEISIEDLTAKAFSLDEKSNFSFEDLKPRSFSFLPVGIACQAKCKFCFSKSSISRERIKNLKDFPDFEKWLQLASKRGAERFVITGGGDPGLFGYDNLCSSIELSKKYFKKSILFSNGIFLEKKKTDDEIIGLLKGLKVAGLDILSLSMHHHNVEKNTFIMGVKTHSDRLIKIFKEHSDNSFPKLRLTCVIQKNGIESSNCIRDYLNYAIENNISEIAFKELYVSSSQESLYADIENNIYSREHQVSLDIIDDYCSEENLKPIGQLPWGSLIYRQEINGKTVQFVSYTEPSLGWEKHYQIARSWNLLNNNNCYASLETESSKISLG